MQRSARTTIEADAIMVRDRIRADMWRRTQLGEAGAGHTWAEAVELYLDRARRRRNRALADVEKHLVWLEPRLSGALEDIDEDRIADALREKGREGVMRLRHGEWVRVRDVAPATLNRYYSTISAVLHCALRRGWIAKVPHWERGREDVRREYLTPEQWTKLRDQLPEHLRILAMFSIATGLRQRVVTHLEWSWVRLDAGILVLPSTIMKNDADHGVPLNSAAVRVLQAQAGRNPRWVFPYGEGEHAKPIEQPAGAAWRKALARAGLPANTRWHSLRRTWAIWHLEAGTPIEQVMRMGGWKRMDVLLAHYAQHTVKAAARYAEAVAPALV